MGWLELELSIRRRTEEQAAICAIDVVRIDDNGKGESTIRSLALFSNAPMQHTDGSYDDWVIVALQETLATLIERRGATRPVKYPDTSGRT